RHRSCSFSAIALSGGRPNLLQEYASDPIRIDSSGREVVGEFGLRSLIQQARGAGPQTERHHALDLLQDPAAALALELAGIFEVDAVPGDRLPQLVDPLAVYRGGLHD